MELQHMNDDFAEIFQRATGHSPFAYQVRLATQPRLPSLVAVPTGLGKTAAVVMAWIWRRRFDPRDEIRTATPRRLVYVLPMRVLVEQTYQEAVRWLDRLGLLAGQAAWSEDHTSLRGYRPEPEDPRPPSPQGRQPFGPAQRIPVYLLLGGEADQDWALWPESDAVLIGTQDMLLSRALNRGYAASRSRWPMEFGLLHNDCLWVFDEVQLMGSGLATSAQLEAFRTGGKNSPGMGVLIPNHPLWMSATIERHWLETVDYQPASQPPLTLSAAEAAPAAADPGRRIHAVKLLQQAQHHSDSGSDTLAREILHQHGNLVASSNGLTLVVVNTVRRARDLFDALNKAARRTTSPVDILLVHSRFRPPDRRQVVNRLMSAPPTGGRIAVSTQVVEAGVDLSATVLFTELAPWASLVQRFGRVNRRGELQCGHVFWIDVPEKHAAPYTPQELAVARKTLIDIQQRDQPLVGPAALPSVPYEFQQQHVVRRKDIVELFDTTPDLAGADLDISCYVRDAEEHDVYVSWRDFADRPGRGELPPTAAELCPVPVSDFKQFVVQLRKNARPPATGVYWRNYLAGTWDDIDLNRVIPGQIFLLHTAAGGYTPETGWHGQPAKKAEQSVQPLPAPTDLIADTDYDADRFAQTPWQSIAQHTDAVVAELASILQRLPLPDEVCQSLHHAARWHDRGKAHQVFQDAISDGQDGRPARPAPWAARRDIAKAPRRTDHGPGAAGTDATASYWSPYHRPHFRHELASALAALQSPDLQLSQPWRDLAVYLIAAHHGKVRLSIRSLPDEMRAPEGVLFARGVWHGDTLPETDLGGGITAPPMTLDLSPLLLGSLPPQPPSWIERMLTLRDHPALGMFRIAFLEALLRAADCRASLHAAHAATADQLRSTP